MPDEVLNIEDCAREPIHIPGSIQPHGLIFVLREPELTILQVSENASEYLGKPIEYLLDQGLDSFLDPAQEERVRFALGSVDPRDNNPVDLRLETKNGMGWLDGFVHRHAGFSFLELETASLAYNATFLEFYKTISKLTARLHQAPSFTSLLEEAARGIREMTGYDRVLIYRFAANNEGEVVAEAKSDETESLLGLWYPASDVPEQARKLYVLNPIRAIVDATYIPSSLIPVLNPDTKRPTDLSFAGMRSVSPIHCEYLRNMGVRASMSISILHGERLWGLVACHHDSKKFTPYEMRKACTFIGQVLSSEIANRSLQDEAAFYAHVSATQAKFLEQMAGSADSLMGLVDRSPNLLELIPSDGAAIVVGDKAQLLGNTPSYDDLMKIIALLRSADAAPTFVTHCLQNHFPLNKGMRETASGLIALEISLKPLTYVLFFRSEIAQTVRWGGNPEKPVLASEDGLRLGPRRSFEVWKEEVRGQSLPWSESQLRAANELRNLITVVLFSKESGRS